MVTDWNIYILQLIVVTNWAHHIHMLVCNTHSPLGVIVGHFMLNKVKYYMTVQPLLIGITTMVS